MMKHILIFLFACLAGLPLAAQDATPRLDLLAGVDLNYRNIYHNNRVYDVLLYATPAVKWKPGGHWTLAAQALVPLWNQYGDYYKRVRLNMASVAKEWNVGGQAVKVSAGLFGNERYGVDVKWLWPVTDWLAFDAEAGLTGMCSMATGWRCSRLDRVTGWAGARLFHVPSNSELRLRLGRYVYQDYGVRGIWLRHFRHCSVGAFAEYSDYGKENAGFLVVMMIPPYRPHKAGVHVRPASNFRMTYNYQADELSMRGYTTDPEENEYEGDFETLKGGRR